MATKLTNDELDYLRWTDGLFVGLLDDKERQLFDRAVEAKQAHHSYEGAGGFMGLAKVRLSALKEQEKGE